jgi:DNA polymerase-3 subunit alpha
MNVAVIGPAINQSLAGFSYQDNQIIFGLDAIKGLRHDMVDDLLADRKQNGPYRTFSEFLTRLASKYRKTPLIEALIYAGALDTFSFNRAELIAATPEFISSVELSGHSMSLFKALEPKMPHKEELPLMTRLDKENEYLGAYLSGHPTERFSRLAKQLDAKATNELTVGMNHVFVILYVTKVKVIRTKTGKQMAFVDGSDQVGETSVTVFPNIFSRNQSWLHKDMVILVQGNVEKTTDIQIVANQIEPADNAMRKLGAAQSQSKWFLRIDASHNKNAIFQNLAQLAKEAHGNVPVVVYEAETKRTWKLDQQFNLKSGGRIEERLITIFGPQNVIYQ